MEMKFITSIEELDFITEEEKKELKPVVEKFIFRATPYYLSLIDKNDPNDPIRRIILPSLDELDSWGKLDPSDEYKYTPIEGLEHKYEPTALILLSSVCGGICRHCFRKQIFMKDKMAIMRDEDKVMEYLRNHKEINNVLLSGGDPLMLPTKRLDKVIGKIFEIPHIDFVRIGTKMTAFYPHRIIEDPDFTNMLKKYIDRGKRIYVVVQYNHSKEITDISQEAIKKIQSSGAIVLNQTPLLRGVNDSVDTLVELFENLVKIGVSPYYVFQNRPSLGNKTFAVPIEKGYTIIEHVKQKLSGIGKRVRYIMSHSTGKIETVGLTEKYIYFKYHNAANNDDYGKFMIYKRNRDALWFDDYTEKIDEYVAKGEMYE